jgi:hypothetical protein
MLKSRLLGEAASKPLHTKMTTNAMNFMERTLAPWVVNHVRSFTELSADPCIFIHLMPVSIQLSLPRNASNYQYRLQPLYSIVSVTETY